MLVLDPRFAPLALAQFLRALNANFLKNAMVFLILANLPGAKGESAVALYSALFMLPMIFISGLGGQLADRFDRGRLARLLKAGELAALAGTNLTRTRRGARLTKIHRSRTIFRMAGERT